MKLIPVSECDHPVESWEPDQFQMQFQCGVCGKLMGNFNPGTPGYVERLAEFWERRRESRQTKEAA